MPESVASQPEGVERLAHDLGGPLTVIRGVCFTLERAETDPTRREQLRLIDCEVRRIAAGLSQIQRQAAAPTIAQVDIAELVQVTVQRMGPAAHRAGRRLVGTAEAPGTVDGDGERLRRALENLVVNGVHHARCRVLVTAHAVRHGRQVALFVSDDGPGVDPADRQRIFHPGIRGRGAVGRGRGLGLAIARDVAREHGGDLDLHPSRSGACFRLLLPASGGPQGAACAA